jgi:hypothetical protein
MHVRTKKGKKIYDYDTKTGWVSEVVKYKNKEILVSKKNIGGTDTLPKEDDGWFVKFKKGLK